MIETRQFHSSMNDCPKPIAFSSRLYRMFFYKYSLHKNLFKSPLDPISLTFVHNLLPKHHETIVRNCCLASEERNYLTNLVTVRGYGSIQ
jgi:hypothetical protein